MKRVRLRAARRCPVFFFFYFFIYFFLLAAELLGLDDGPGPRMPRDWLLRHRPARTRQDRYRWSSGRTGRSLTASGRSRRIRS